MNRFVVDCSVTMAWCFDDECVGQEIPCRNADVVNTINWCPGNIQIDGCHSAHRCNCYHIYSENAIQWQYFIRKRR